MLNLSIIILVMIRPRVSRKQIVRVSSRAAPENDAPAPNAGVQASEFGFYL